MFVCVHVSIDLMQTNPDAIRPMSQYSGAPRATCFAHYAQYNLYALDACVLDARVLDACVHCGQVWLPVSSLGNHGAGSQEHYFCDQYNGEDPYCQNAFCSTKGSDVILDKCTE